jgi:flavin-dependent dehydrogenase
MQQFDVVIIGAGPAGGHCARLLAQKGYQVLLVEQHRDFRHNNYSSAGTPLETLAQFDLPASVVARYWQSLTLVSSQQQHTWHAPTPQGAVFDFAKLRAYLAETAQSQGAQVWLGHRFLAHQQEAGKTLVTLKQRGGSTISVLTQVLVDATGYARAVMYPPKVARPPFYQGTGIEYLIEVDADTYAQYQDTLVFFLGYRWSPRGYSWIFPMDHQQLKVGSAWIEGEHRYLKNLRPLRDYTTAILRDYLKLETYKTIEIHGSVLDYASGLQDIYCQDNVIAIGDAVSTVNFLGGEGIRHAMQGANIAVPYIEAYLQNQRENFQGYEQAMKAHFLQKWNASEQIGKRVYLEYSDDKIDLGVAYLKYFSFPEVIDLLFNYRFDKIYGGLYPYLLKKLAQWQQRFQQWFHPRKTSP